ncbi:hypothetical protein ACO2I3_12395 [Leptospira interrogans]
MMPGTFIPQGFMGAGDGIDPNSFIGILTNLGLTSGLKICLDAGDINSYNPGINSQVLYDTSGNDHHFYLGQNESISNPPFGNDPVYYGTPGGLSAGEYFAREGISGPMLRLAQSNPAWLNTFHKNGAVFTIVSWWWKGSGGALAAFGNSGAAGTGTGFSAGTSGGTHRFRVLNNSVEALEHVGHSQTAGRWMMESIAINENGGAGACSVGLNKSHTTFNGNYTSPATGDASYTFEIGARGNAANPIDTNSRFALFAVWDGVKLTTSQLDDIYDAIYARHYAEFQHSITFKASSTSTGSIITVPGTRAAGDIIVIFQYAQQSSGTPTSVTPSGFTQAYEAATDFNRRIEYSYKISDGTEGTVTGMNGNSANKKICLVFSTTGTSISHDSFTSDFTTSNPAAQVMAAHDQAFPSISLGGYWASGAVSPRTFTPAKDSEVNTDTNFYLAYRVFNDWYHSGDISIDMDDEGSNILSSGRIKVTG